MRSKIAFAGIGRRGHRIYDQLVASNHIREHGVWRGHTDREDACGLRGRDHRILRWCCSFASVGALCSFSTGRLSAEVYFAS